MWLVANEIGTNFGTVMQINWTLDRLQAELAKDGVPFKRSQAWRILRAEHL